MATENDELRTFLLKELKIKREELDAAKLSERAALDEAQAWRQKAIAAEEARDKGSRDSHYTKYKKLAADAEAAREKLDEECEILRKALADTRKGLEMSNTETASKLARYKTRLKAAKAAQRQAETDCENLLNELAGVKESLNAGSEEMTLAQGHTTDLDPVAEVSYSKVERLTDEAISRALDCLPIVEDHPAGDLESIGHSLGATIARLPKDSQYSLKHWHYQSFKQTQVLFGECLQHGYMLKPQHCVKKDKKTGEETWFQGNTLHLLAEPFETFQFKAGEWYYIGTYRGFYICDAPWETFSRWTEQEIRRFVRATIIGSGEQKNELYSRVRDQYSTGKVIAAYVGIQCIGFNHSLYEQLRDAAGQVMSKSVKRARGPLECLDEGVSIPNKRQRTGGISNATLAVPAKHKPVPIPIPS